MIPNDDILKHLDESYQLIPMKDITDEARALAVRWCENYRPSGSIDLPNKHKLASDIMNYAEHHAKEFQEWLAANVEVIREEKITLYRYCSRHDGWGNYTLDDIYIEFTEQL